jgi:hypothetical protein
MSGLGGQVILCVPFKNTRGSASWFPFGIRQTSAQANAPSAAAWNAADWRQKATWALPYYSAQGISTWHSWKMEPAGTWKRRCFDLSQRAMVRVSVTETLFKSIDTECHACTSSPLCVGILRARRCAQAAARVESRARASSHAHAPHWRHGALCNGVSHGASWTQCRVVLGGLSHLCALHRLAGRATLERSAGARR